MKFLDIDNNKEDEATWEKIIQDPFDADLNLCPYQQNFKESMSCPKYQDINEEEGEEEEAEDDIRKLRSPLVSLVFRWAHPLPPLSPPPEAAAAVPRRPRRHN